MTTLTAPRNTLQASLIEALAGDQPERVLEQAFLQLSHGGDLALLLAMLKALVRVGLAGLAVRLLRSASGLLSAEPQLAALADQLAGLPSGEVAAPVLESRFRANLEALLAARSQLEQWADDFEQAGIGHRVFASTASNQHVVRDDPARRLQFVFQFGDHAAQARAAALPQPTLSTALLMVGAPSPALWKRAIELRGPGGYLPPIDIIEPDADVFGMWLRLLDDAQALRDQRVGVFIGPDAIPHYRQFLLEHPCRVLPGHCTTNFRPRWQPPAIGNGFFESVQAALDARRKELSQVISQRYADRDAAYWRDRFRSAADSGAPLRIAGFTTRYSTVIQHAMRGLAGAFKRKGCRFEFITQPDPSSALVDVPGALAQGNFDLIVVLNHLRFEFTGVIPANIPYVGWIQDSMDALWDRKAGRSVGGLDVVIGHSPQIMASLYDYPIERFIASNNLTDPVTYSSEPVSPGDLDPYRCDVSYVGHGSGTPEQLIEEITAAGNDRLAAYLRQFLSLARSRLNEQGWINCHELVELMLRAERASGHPPLTAEVRRAHVFPQITRVYDRLLRHQTLEWTASWAQSRGKRFSIHGQGWENHPRLSPWARGEVESGYPLRCVYQASSVGLQVNGHGSLHQRLLDGLACGAFMLTRFNPADFVRQPFLEIQRIIRQRSLESLDDIARLRRSDPVLNAACESARRYSGICIAPLRDPARQAYHQALREGNCVREMLTDEGMFQALCDLRLLPARAAADLPGFECTVFRSEIELHQMLDHYVDNPQARQALVEPMCQAVLLHDTYDGLVDRILRAFATGVVDQS